MTPTFVPMSTNPQRLIAGWGKVDQDGISVDVKINSFHPIVKPQNQTTRNIFEDALTMSMSRFYIVPFSSIILSC